MSVTPHNQLLEWCIDIGDVNTLIFQINGHQNAWIDWLSSYFVLPVMFNVCIYIYNCMMMISTSLAT